MTEQYVLFRLPLSRAFALCAAATIREGRKLPGMSYADMEIAEAIEAATERYFAAKKQRRK